ncbi:amyloid fiber anchoring/assembly protein TapA [Lentibacillus salicampi]|nr:amyloid fiber anchoring/assembly protein TapA [Lentibacillus salicampi]
MSRLRKFKKRKKLILASKLLVSCYMLIFAFGYLTSGTGAYFNSQSNDKQVIQAGTWWDGSELVFPGSNTQNIKACPPEKIAVDIKNKGFSMIQSSDYEVYYVKNGNPGNNGRKIANGTIEPIKEGETISLIFEADQVGSYMLKVSQHPEYNGDNQDPWSEKIMVKCIENKPQAEQEEKKGTDEQNTAADEPKNRPNQEHGDDESKGAEEKTQENTEVKDEQNQKDDREKDKDQKDDEQSNNKPEEKKGVKENDETINENKNSNEKSKDGSKASEQKPEGRPGDEEAQ